MPDPIKVGNVTIHQVVEQEGPFFDMLPFFPTGALGEKQVHIVDYELPGVIAATNSSADSGVGSAGFEAFRRDISMTGAAVELARLWPLVSSGVPFFDLRGRREWTED